MQGLILSHFLGHSTMRLFSVGRVGEWIKPYSLSPLVVSGSVDETRVILFDHYYTNEFINATNFGYLKRNYF